MLNGSSSRVFNTNSQNHVGFWISPLDGLIVDRCWNCHLDGRPRDECVMYKWHKPTFHPEWKFDHDISREYMDGELGDHGHGWIRATNSGVRVVRSREVATISPLYTAMSAAQPEASSSTAHTRHSRDESSELSSAPPSPSLKHLATLHPKSRAGPPVVPPDSQPSNLLSPQSLYSPDGHTSEGDEAAVFDEGAVLAQLKRAWIREEQKFHKRQIEDLEDRLKESEERDRTKKRKIEDLEEQLRDSETSRMRMDEETEGLNALNAQLIAELAAVKARVRQALG